MVVEDVAGVGADLVKAIQGRGVEVVLQSVDDTLPQDLGALVLVGNGGDGKRSREFLRQAFQKTREAAPLLRGCKGALFTITGMDGYFGMKGKDFDPLTYAVYDQVRSYLLHESI